MERLAKKLTDLGVKSDDLKCLKVHIRRQKKQIVWYDENGTMKYDSYKKKSKN